MKNIVSSIMVAGTVAACPTVIQAATWITSDPGTYSWTDTDNWENGTLPTSTTKASIGSASTGYVEANGHQTITGGGETSYLNVYTAIPVGTQATRTFAGDITARYAEFRCGTNEISGTLTLTGTSTQSGTYSRAGTSNKTGAILCSVLDILSGGSVLAEGAHAFYIGRHDEDDSPASGRIHLREGGTFMLSSSSVSGYSGLLLGMSSTTSSAPWFASSYVQDGGYAKIGRFYAGYEKKANASMTVSGGVLELPYVTTANTRFVVGHGGFGVFQQLGGEIYVNTNHVMSTMTLLPNYGFIVGDGTASSNGVTNACFYACGGKFESGSAFLIQGPLNDETGVMPASATIDGTAMVTTRSLRVGANTGDGQAVLNLNGGELNTMNLSGYNGRVGACEINADGGTVSFPADGTVENQFLYLDHINIYE